MSLSLLPSPPLAVIPGAGNCFEPSSLASWRNTVITGQADKMVGTMSKSNSESCLVLCHDAGTLPLTLGLPEQAPAHSPELIPSELQPPSSPSFSIN